MPHRAVRRAPGRRAGQRRRGGAARRWPPWPTPAATGGCRSCAAAPGCICRRYAGPGRHPRPGEQARGRGAGAAAGGRGRGAARAARGGRPGHGRGGCGPSDGQRLARAWEVLARHRARPGGLAARPRRRRPIALRRDPARPAAGGAARGDRAAVRRHAGGGRAGRGAGAAGAGARSGPAGDAGAWCAGTGGLSPGRDHACRSGRAARCWRPASTPKRQATWFRHHALAEPGRTHTIHARFAGLDAISRKQHGRNLWSVS